MARRVNTANTIIVLCVLLFGISKLVVYLNKVTQEQLNQWLCVPQSLPLFLKQPWTLLSYAFYHVSEQHLFWNMLLLFFAGHIFFNLFNTQQFIKAYAFGIIGGGIAFLAIAYFFPTFTDNTMLLGASAAIMGILAFVVTVSPSYNVYIFTFKIKLLYVILAFILFDIINISVNTGGKIAHFGGIVGGICAGLTSKYSFRSPKKAEIPQEESPKKEKKVISEEQQIQQHQVNQLLEKISASGYASLTDQEKKFLFEVSKGKKG
ncbi:hypothetical protein RCZ04_09970 [Capnocytophaga sp. HP1101]